MAAALLPTALAKETELTEACDDKGVRSNNATNHWKGSEALVTFRMRGSNYGFNDKAGMAKSNGEVREAC